MSNLELFKFHTAPTKLVGYKKRAEYIPLYLWQRQMKNLRLHYSGKTAAERAVHREELMAWMPVYIRDPEIFGLALQAFVQNGGMKNGKRIPEIEKLIVNIPDATIAYARQMKYLTSSNGNKSLVWPEAETTIINSGNGENIVLYFAWAGRPLSKAAKSRIMQTPDGIAYYERQARKNIWREAIPVITQSVQFMSQYLRERTTLSTNDIRLPEIEPYIIKANNPELAVEYLIFTDYDHKINPTIYQIIERNPKLLKQVLDTYIEDRKDAESDGGWDGIPRNIFVERAVLLLADVPSALAYTHFRGTRVPSFEKWLLDHAIKDQNAENLLGYILSTMMSDFGSSSVWVGCIPTIVKYSSPQQLLDFADDLNEYTGWNEAAVRFLGQLEKAIAPIIVDAVVNGTIAMDTIINYVGSRDWANFEYNEDRWPMFERLLQAQSPEKYKEYIKKLRTK